MNCPNCSQPIIGDVSFCRNCGTSIISNNISTNPDHAQTTNPNAREHDSRVGLILDEKYELIEQLGRGGMGSVYRAKRLHIGDEVAVKLLHPELVRQKHALERFRREARSAAMISHQNVVSIHDFGDVSGADSEAYIVMELVKGVSLASLLEKQGRMSPERAVRLMREICSGVGVAHRRGLLHRDLKPDNVIVSPPSHEGEAETAKVVDFGLAKVRDVASSALTQTGAVMGTLYYMSPEQCNGEELDARADVYSLGAMLYELLSGSPPFIANNAAGLISKHLHQQPKPFPPDLLIPPGLEAACLRALSKARDQRQPDAIAFGRELELALQRPYEPRASASAATLLLEEKVQTPTQTKSGSPLKWILAGVILLLLGIFLVGSVVGIKYVIDRTKRDDTTIVNDVTNQNSNSQSQNSSQTTNTETVATSNSALDLRGSWTGTYGPLSQPAKLSIQNQKGSEIEGVLEQTGHRVAFKGTLNAASKTITMKQTSVLVGSDWSLGEDSGTVSDDGNNISGTGQDQIGGTLGMSYGWSFVRARGDRKN